MKLTRNEEKALTYHMCKKFHSLPKEECPLIIATAIAKAVQTYSDKHNMKFLSFVYKVTEGEVINYLRSTQCDKRRGIYVESELMEDLNIENYSVFQVNNTEQCAFHREILDDVIYMINRTSNVKHKNILISVLLKEDERVLTPNERKVIARFRSTIKEKYGEVFEW